MGIDPGANTLGVALLYLDDDLNIRKITSDTLTPWTVHRHDILALPQTAMRTTEKCEYLSVQIRGILRNNIVSAVAIETPFFNSKFPAAFSSLLTTFTMLRTTIHQHNVSIPILEIAPTKAKTILGANSSTKFKGKDLVRNAITVHPELDHLLPNMTMLSEHALDAIGVAYSYVFLLRKTRIYDI